MFYLVILQAQIVIYSFMMNKKVKKALLCLLKDEVMVSSWGITNISIKKSSICFDVAGFIYRGRININCEQSFYEIQLDNGITIQCPENNLLNVLDEAIEKTDYYSSNLKKWIITHN